MDPKRAHLVSRIRASLGENLGLKLSALLIAIALHSLVRGAGTVQRSLDLTFTAAVPHSQVGAPVLMTQLPDKVRLTVRGPPSVVATLRPEDVGPIQLDLRGRSGVRTLRLDPALVRLPAGVVFLGFAPESLTLNWDTLAARTLPVRPTLVGVPAPGVRASDVVNVNPARVRVEGPALYVDPLVVVHTDPVNISGFGVGRYERRVALEPPRSGVGYDLAGGVRVGFELLPQITERHFEHLTITALGTARVTIRPPVVDVVLRGAPAVLDPMTDAQVVPVVDLGDLGTLRAPSPGRVHVRSLPDGVEVVSVSPAEILVVPAR